MAKAQVIGIDKFRTGIAASIAALRGELSSEMRSMAEKLAQEIRIACPEDTGALRDSIKLVVKQRESNKPSIEILIGDRVVDYAAHVEYGTSKMAARPFVRPAMERFRRKFPGAVESLIAQTWDSPA